MAHTNLLTVNQFRVLFAILAASAVVKLLAAVVFIGMAFMAQTDNLGYAGLAVLFALGFSWMVRSLQPTVKPLFG